MRIAAIDIGGTNTKYTVYDTAQSDYHRSTFAQTPTDFSNGAPAYLRDHLVPLIRTMGPVDAIAIAMGGQMDTANAVVTQSSGHIPGYAGLQVRGILQEYFDLPVYALNDVNAAALGEAVYGAGRDYPDFLCLTYGTGVGGAIVMGGKVYEGFRGAAGEFGHFITHPDGIPCECGCTGCYERYAATTALVRMVREATGEVLNGRQIMQRRSEPAIAACVDAWLDEIVLGLVTLSHIFNPACMVLGGGIMEQQELTRVVKERLDQRVMINYRHCDIRPAELGNAAGMLGAVAYTLQQLGQL